MLDLPVELDARGTALVVREAKREDLPSLMQLLSDDPVSATRGDVGSDRDRQAYATALDEIAADDRNIQLVAECDGDVVAMLQLTTIPGLARRGATRLQVEAVRVRADMRSAGIGAALMTWVERDAAVALGAQLIQLTSDAARTDAHRFYERLGYSPSHIGFKRTL